MALNSLLAAPFIALIPAVALDVFHDEKFGTAALVTAQGVGRSRMGLALGTLFARFGTRRVLQGVPAVAESFTQGRHLAGHRAPGHQPVVGVDGHPELQRGEQPDRVVGDRRRGSGLHVRRRRHLQWNPLVPYIGRQPAERAVPSRSTAMSSTIRTPCPSRSAPHHWIASQMDGNPNASPA